MNNKFNKMQVFTFTFIAALIALVFGGVYWVIEVACLGWLFYDSRERLHKKWYLWLVATLIFSPIVIAFYLAKRNLKANERREGGYMWNLAKNLCIFWTALIISSAFLGMGNIADISSGINSNYEMAGLGLGATLGLGILCFLWFAGVCVTLLISFFFKKSTIENGPTGELAIKIDESNTDSGK